METALIFASFLGWVFIFVIWGSAAQAIEGDVRRSGYPQWFINLSPKARKWLVIGTGTIIVLAPIVAIYLWQRIPLLFR